MIVFSVFLFFFFVTQETSDVDNLIKDLSLRGGDWCILQRLLVFLLCAYGKVEEKDEHMENAPHQSHQKNEAIDLTYITFM